MVQTEVYRSMALTTGLSGRGGRYVNIRMGNGSLLCRLDMELCPPEVALAAAHRAIENHELTSRTLEESLPK